MERKARVGVGKAPEEADRRKVELFVDRMTAYQLRNPGGDHEARMVDWLDRLWYREVLSEFHLAVWQQSLMWDKAFDIAEMLDRELGEVERAMKDLGLL